LQDFAAQKFLGVIPPTTAEAPPPRHQFPLGSPAFPLLLFDETTSVATLLFLVASFADFIFFIRYSVPVLRRPIHYLFKYADLQNRGY